MPWTLYRYLLKDLLRLLVMTTALLVFVISLAAAIKPLSQGLLGPVAMVKYVFFLTPTMLGFVTPFAGAFAATLVFNRVVADNELTACRASGMSYRMILMPVLVTGLILTMGLFYLSNWVVPSFYRRTASMVEKDLTQVLVQQVKAGRPVALGDIVLYADAADDTQPPPVNPESRYQPSKLIRLRGVAVGRVDQSGRLRSDSTAARADLLLYPVDDEVWVTIGLEDVMYHDAARGDLVWLEKWLVPGVRLPQPFRDKPRFLSWPQLRTLAQQPERYDVVREHKRYLAEAIAAEQLLDQIRSTLTGARGGGRSVTLLGSNPGQQFVISAPQVAQVDQGLRLEADPTLPVRVNCRRDGLITRRIEAESGDLWIEVAETHTEPWVCIDLENTRVYDASLQGQPTERATLPTLRSYHPQPVLEPLGGLPIDTLLRQSMTLRDSSMVGTAAQKLRDQILSLYRTALAQLHERAALAVSCMLVLLLSSVLSLKMTHTMPLVAYFWSFVPAIVVVILVHSGENLTSSAKSSLKVGLGLLWLGPMLMAVATGHLYWRLSRN